MPVCDRDTIPESVGRGTLDSELAAWLPTGPTLGVDVPIGQGRGDYAVLGKGPRPPIGSVELPKEAARTPLAIELRHLRYFVALADAGNFTHAAQRMFIAQPTLSQQIRRLEQIVGAQLVQRRRDGVRLTRAGAVLLEASRNVLSLVDQEL